VYDIIFGFPCPIILAILINELRNKAFKKTFQTISYLPYFVSMVVVAGIIRNFTASSGFINSIIVFFGGEASSLLFNADLFKGIYVGSNIWQFVGFNSIIYLAALTGINSELYEAARIDGAGRLKQALHVTLPGIAPTIIIMFILRIGRMMNVSGAGFEKILLIYNPMTYTSADVIQSFVYRKGLLEADYSYSTAVGLFNSVINFFILILANHLSGKVSETSLW
jgi:putative aldouronate transport system permease protein